MASTNTLQETSCQFKDDHESKLLQYEGKFYKPTTGVAMGLPLSSIIAEISLIDLEQNRLNHLLEGEKRVYYNRYVYDIFIIHNQTKITAQSIFEQLNAQHRDLQFTKMKKRITKLLT
jgi:hypothetical protein